MQEITKTDLHLIIAATKDLQMLIPRNLQLKILKWTVMWKHGLRCCTATGSLSR